MRFTIPDIPPSPEFDAFVDCVDYAVGDKSRREEGEFLIALFSFLERLAANVATGRPVSLPPLGTFTTALEPIYDGGLNGHGPCRRTPIFIPDGGFQLEVDDPLPPDHVTMEGIFGPPDEDHDEPQD